MKWKDWLLGFCFVFLSLILFWEVIAYLHWEIYFSKLPKK